MEAVEGERMNEDQKKALEGLMAVECHIDAKGCGNQWCEAREKVAAAFDLKKAD